MISSNEPNRLFGITACSPMGKEFSYFVWLEDLKNIGNLCTSFESTRQLVKAVSFFFLGAAFSANPIPGRLQNEERGRITASNNALAGSSNKREVAMYLAPAAAD